LFPTGRPRSVAIVAAMFSVVVVLVGCSSRGTVFVDGGTSYDAATVMKVAEGIDTSQFANTPSDQAPDLRHKALTALRSQGGRAVPVADMLTKTFPAETRGVPVYFERATFNGKNAVIMIEAAGPANGKLTAKRVWVLDEQGGVLYVGGR
jgi:hypothetical protein